MTRRKNRDARIPQFKRFRSSGRNRFRRRAARQFPINRAPVEPAGRSLPRAEARIFDAFLRRLRPEKAVLPKEDSAASPQHSPHKFGSALGLSKMKKGDPRKIREPPVCSAAGRQFAKLRPSPAASMRMGRVRSTSPAKIRFDSSLTMVRWMVRLTGRAPYSGS